MFRLMLGSGVLWNAGDVPIEVARGCFGAKDLWGPLFSILAILLFVLAFLGHD